METTGIGSSSATPRESDAFGQMKSEDFFALLISEMQNQDPFNPNETADMINQVSQIRSIELSADLTSTLGQMTDQQRSLGTAELIGKFVEGEVTDAEGNVTQLSGVVTGVTLDGKGNATLELDSGQQMPATALRSITSAESPAAASTLSATTTPAAQADPNKADANARVNNQAQMPWFTLDSQIRI